MRFWGVKVDPVVLEDLPTGSELGVWEDQGVLPLLPYAASEHGDPFLFTVCISWS